VLTNATSATLMLTNIQFSPLGNYSVVVTNVAGSVTSSPPATLTVQQFLVPAGQTANISVPSLNSSPSISGGKNVSFNITGSPGSQCAVYSSTDLKNWMFVGDVMLDASGTAPFTVNVTSGMPCQFYCVQPVLNH
jgi:hypothetical protein